MNVFRLAGDSSHLLAIIMLLLKIWKSRSCAGISGRSQILFAIVFTARYLDLATNYVSLYNSVLKIIYILATYGTLFLIFYKFRTTYDRNHDTFRIEFLVGPCVVLAFIINHEFSQLEVLWTFSIYLEAVAILPQIFMLTKTGRTDSVICYYLFALGMYRALYIVNWVYRYYAENFFDPISIVSGCVETAILAFGLAASRNTALSNVLKKVMALANTNFEGSPIPEDELLYPVAARIKPQGLSQLPLLMERIRVDNIKTELQLAASESAKTIEEPMKPNVHFHRSGENYKTDVYVITPTAMEVVREHLQVPGEETTDVVPSTIASAGRAPP